ncbi:MAG: 2,3-bisphosphoglycerate-independent phosphoglycerate mutase [Candidatus Eremiobacteraeota bacterium]|nr:2,3-bisphosphoglycerate-independent phosphoglycerate mutase [Candidatus Eremiobacteraeota bacterium]
MSIRARQGPLVLAIPDGWGHRDEERGNAIAAADLPNWRRMLATYPHTLLAASGEEVGLPKGVMGNSEVGHINMGSGRVVPQGVVVINESLADGTFAQNPVLHAALEHVRDGGRLHLMGLLSDGKVHSSIDHLFALIDAAVIARVKFAVHPFGDGRDVPPSSMQTYLGALEAHLAQAGATGAIASLMGRFYAMDRDKRWDRTERAYRALAAGKADYACATAGEALRAAYARGETDEFIVPSIVGEPCPIADGDAVIFFNFRPDRARELTLAFARPGFAEFPVHPYKRLMFATMTKYEDDFANPVLFGPRPQSETFGEIVAGAGLTQLRLAETEKYAHVTYFFNGGREDVFPGEVRELIPSNRSVATYDLAPEMRAGEITTVAVEDIHARAHDLIVMNYSNADMVGHTGVMSATISGCETLDVALGRLEQAVLDSDGVLAITADHGNAEDKIDAEGNPLTAHTTNPVPFVLVSRGPLGTLAPNGRLSDIAPTLLPLLGLTASAAMTGRDLLR